MAFDTDVFISYAHLDNQPLTSGAVGWVSEFHEALTKRLGEVLGKSPRIWRDPKLQGNDVFADEIEQRFKGAAVLVSVITPRYVDSDWCLREVAGFWRVADNSGGAVVGNKARVFKVLKTPVQRTRMPPQLDALLGYEFFRLQSGSGRPLEFNRIYGPEAERDFWVRLNDLAYDLAELLNRLEDPAGAAALDKPAVYLATTTSDLQPERDALRRELLRHGHPVLPNEELPLVADALEASVARHLDACAVSIHLIGASYGIVPEGTPDSVCAIETRLAALRSQSGQLVRLVWIPRGIEIGDKRHRDLVESLRNDPVPGPGSDLIEAPFEDIKALSLVRLEAAAQLRAGAPVTSPSAHLRIYVICEERDLVTVVPVQEYLLAQGFEATLPAFEGDETELREDHTAQMRECDAVLIFYGAAGEVWLRQKLSDVRRLAAVGRTRPLRAAVILIVPPSTSAKERLLTRDAMVVRATGDDGLRALVPFIAELQRAMTPP